jgi:hypothetical protein
MGEERGVYRVLVGKPEERDHWGVPDIDGRIILRKEMGCGGMDWIGLAQERHRWRAIVSAVMNLHVP